jgi:peptidylprolyl isomerase
MKNNYFQTFVAACVLALAPLSAEEEKKEITFDSLNKEEVAETLGHLIVRHLASPGFELDSEAIIRGIRAEKEGKASPLSEEQYEQAMYVVQEHLFNKTSEENLEKAVAFLKDNAQKEGVKIVDEQLHYTVSKEGEGAVVTENSIPLIHYKGSLMDGTTFASSLESGEPITLPIGQTIPGFSKGMVGMKEGEKRTLYIHPELAYGVSGNLPPNSLLVFEVEVLKADSHEEEVADLAQEEFEELEESAA